MIISGVLVGLLIAVRVTSRAPIVRNKLISALDRELDADVQLQSLDVKIFPRLRIHGGGLTLRLHNQQQPAPLIHIDEFEVAGGIFGMLRHQHRFTYVELHGLRITIPPKTGHDRESGAKAGQTLSGPVLIDHLVSDNAQLLLVPNDPRKQLKIFSIHHLEMESVGFKRALPFRATLINPIPQGQVQTTGTFGPWVADDPGQTPINGSYDFKHADLSTIHGLAGMLESRGQFGGELDQIDVRGTTRTPDFQVTGAGLPIPLETRFHVLVDGTNGDTYLKDVEATLGTSELTASGAVLATPGVKGRTVNIDAGVKHGRLEDVLRVAVDNPRPVMTGSISLQTSIVLPPGKDDVADRLQLDGQFTLDDARFTDRAVQQKLVMLSRRSRGNPEGADGRVFTDMRGKFTLKNDRVHFGRLTFNVPGAGIQLSGRYGLRTGRIDFDGTMAMQASISKAAGGWKGLLLKPFDPLFRHHGSGAVLPIHIQGTRQHPKFGVDWKQALGGW
ncbi:MAG TPA: AsmA-like C-terminal region-containing protein [Vicinamibacterales bacterium]